MWLHPFTGLVLLIPTFFFLVGCLKPSLQTPIGAPKCPVDHVAMQSALLAIPTDDPQAASGSQKQWNASNNHGVLSAESRGSSS